MIAGKKTATQRQTVPAEQRFATLGEMTSGIAPDFENLLTVIGSAIEIIEMSSGQPECACLSGVREAVVRGLKLTSEFLMFESRRELTEAEGVGIDLCDVNVFLGNLERPLRYAAGPGVRVVLELAPDIPNCVIEPSRFDTASLNLIANARDAMSGAGEIQISAQPCSKPATFEPPNPREYVRLHVGDSGEGVTSEVVQNIFDPFFPTKGMRPGWGFHKIMNKRQTGGHTSVASENGTGAAIDLFFTLSACGHSPLVHHEAELGHVVGRQIFESSSRGAGQSGYEQRLGACRVSEVNNDDGAHS